MCERKRERERVCERERVQECKVTLIKEREGECMCVREERECVCMCVRKRECSIVN